MSRIVTENLGRKGRRAYTEGVLRADASKVADKHGGGCWRWGSGKKRDHERYRSRFRRKVRGGEGGKNVGERGADVQYNKPWGGGEE